MLTNPQRLAAYIAEREDSVPPRRRLKRYQRRKVGHARPFTFRYRWTRARRGDT